MIDHEFLEQVERFNLALQKNSQEIRQGEQSSSSTGQGMVFSDHKKYSPGDDIRKIDWKAYARTDEVFVKRFEEEKSVTVHILVDRSSSMDYGDTNKYEFAAKLGLITSHMVTNTNDRFRFSVFSETVTDISSARRNAKLAELVDTLNQLGKTPESRIERCITDYSKRIKNKSVVVIISDFLTDTDEVEEAIEKLEGTETVLVNVLSEKEFSPEMEGDKILKDPESGSKLRTYLSKKTRKSYNKELEQHTDRIEEASHRSGADYVLKSTDEDVFETFLDIWQKVNR